MSKISQAAITLEQSGFTIADRNGFKMFQFFPLHFRMYKNKVPDVGPIRIAKQMGSSNLVCLVPGVNGNFSQNNVIVFNVEANRGVTEITIPSRYGAVTNIHVSHNRLAVFTFQRVYVYSFPNDIQQIRSEEIRSNPKGISAMSYDPTTTSCYLAYPGYKEGTIHIMNLNTLTARESKSPIVIDAHLTEVAQVALNCQGTLVASGSIKGTVVRVFDARTKGMLYELRRGTVQAHLQCIAFSSCSSFLGVASDKGTLHIFGIRDAEPQKKRTMLERNCGTSSILRIQLDRQVLALGFSKQSARHLPGIVAICSDGTYWRYHFSKDNTSGKCTAVLPPYFEQLPDFAEDAAFFRTPLD
ncbi:unnamed protein product [Caenorhabditis nigoni]